MQNYILPLIIIIMFSLLFSFFGISSKSNIKNLSNSVYDYSALSIDGDSISISQFKGKTTVLFLGAGSVTKWAHDFYSLLKRVYE